MTWMESRDSQISTYRCFGRRFGPSALTLMFRPVVAGDFSTTRVTWPYHQRRISRDLFIIGAIPYWSGNPHFGCEHNVLRHWYSATAFEIAGTFLLIFTSSESMDTWRIQAVLNLVATAQNILHLTDFTNILSGRLYNSTQNKMTKPHMTFLNSPFNSCGVHIFCFCFIPTVLRFFSSVDKLTYGKVNSGNSKSV